MVLSATLTNSLLIPQKSGSESDAVIQADFAWQEQESPDVFTSQYLAELLAGLSSSPHALMLFDSNILGATADLSVAGTSSGLVEFNLAAVPEPSTWAMEIIAFAGIGLAGWRARRKSRAVTA